MPRPVEALPCGSRSISSTRQPVAASAVARLIAVVVLPTPPFWFATAIRIIAASSLPARRTPSATMIRASGSVTLGSSRNSPCHEGSSASSSVCAFRPLGSSQTLFAVDKAVPNRSSRSKGAKARALITSNGRRGRRSALPATISTANAERLGGAMEEIDPQAALLDQRHRARVQQQRRSARESRRRCRDRPRSRPATARIAGAGPNRRCAAARAGRGSPAKRDSAVHSPPATRPRSRQAAPLFHVKHRYSRSTQERASASSIKRPCGGRGRGSPPERPA